MMITGSILFVGDNKTGKSTLVEKYVRDKYSEKYEETQGVVTDVKTVSLWGRDTNIQLLDPNGRLGYREFDLRVKEHINAVVLVFDITNYSSYCNVTNWYLTIP
mmetsp:Transcript_40421/g.35882  ORF Transcript_40421/g.35882 Transcript_40421/m.35882 type:complete len:104 (-) Transcript_40421:361-672(-)